MLGPSSEFAPFRSSGTPFDFITGPIATTSGPAPVTSVTSAIEDIVQPVSATMPLLQEHVANLEALRRRLFALTSLPSSVITPECLGVATEFFSQLVSVMREVNSLARPRAEREPQIAQLVTPIVVRSWSSSPPEGNAELVLRLGRVMHEGPSGQIKVTSPDWQRPLLQLFDGADVTQLYPDMIEYIRASSGLRAEIPEPQIQSVRPEQGQNGSGAEGAENGPAGKLFFSGGFSAFNDATLSGKEQAKLFDRLVLEIRDVDPFTLQSVSDVISCKLLPRKIIVSHLIELSRGVEGLLSDYARGSEDREASTLPMLAVHEGKLKVAELPIAPNSDTPKIEPEQLMVLLRAVRGALRAVARESRHFNLSDSEAALSSALTMPFGVSENNHADLLLRRLEGRSKAALGVAAEFFSDPVVLRPGRAEWAYPVANPEDLRLFQWAVQHALIASENQQKFSDLISGSLPESFGVASLVNTVAKQVANRSYGALARLLDRELIQARDSLSATSETATSQSPEQRAWRGVSLLTILRVISAQPEVRDSLRTLMVNTEVVRDLVSHLNPLIGEQAILDKSSRDVLAAFGPSLQSCNLKKGDLQILQKIVRNMRILENHPEYRAGLQGNTLFRSGVLLSGPPGVGKTYLTHVIVSELGAKRLTLKPFQAQKSVDLFETGTSSDSLNARITAVTEQLIAEAKKGRSCVFEIDEAEHFLPRRDTPGLSNERRETCVYLLELLNELRINYPNVLIVIATNHPREIDHAGIRDGRVDFEIELALPDEAQRLAVLKQDIGRYLPIDQVEQGKLDELVKLTEGMIFVGIAATINGYFIFEAHARREDDPSYQPNVNDLIAEFSQEKRGSNLMSEHTQ